MKIMLSSDAILGFFFISLICIGLMGNSVLFMLYVDTFLTQSYLKKPIDVIFIHLTLVNVLTISFKLIPDVMSSFGERYFLEDVGCKATLYIYRVTRGLSICTTAFLSVFQAITINPFNSKWAWLRSKLSMCIYPSFLFFWVINLLIYIHIIDTVRARNNFTIAGFGYYTVHCQTNQLEHHHSMAFLSVMVIRDLLFVILMMWSSIYMVTLLYKHRQRTQHILHSLSLSPQSSPEIKAIHTVLLLVGCFVFSYCLNNFIAFYLLYLPKKNLEMERITGIISSCYPSLCPFVLMKNKISKLTSFLSRMTITFSQRTFSR
ncbi:vomeronasal type-1 receptor 4-like [Moschus berezovskii]|uniref:vomeronasal type-1 receptor 4-like n=1 Tax=Moschus berezovskii TaxID=68408 RepID=UPI002444929A|nr:vomeronasal type-1 receptor 4-like [Moschus berezovskii]